MTSRRPTWILLALIVALALVLDLWFYSGFFASDDAEYIYGAHSLMSEALGGPPLDVRPRLGNARLGMTVPGAAVYWLSGGSIDAMAWFHVLYHLGLVVLAFVLGRLLRDDTAGLLAALLAAGNPLFYLYAGAVLPDNATAFWLGLAMIALETMRRRARDDSAAVTWRQALVGYMAAGAALGLAYACKETALIMTVPAAVWVMAAAPGLRDPVWIRNGAFLAAGLLAFVVVEMIGLRVIMGEWVWRLGIVEGGGELLAGRMAEQGVTPLERFGFAYEYRLAPFVPLSLWLVALGAVSYALAGGRDARRGVARNIGLMAFFWWPLLYITIGSTSFTAYRPPSLQTRYYSIVLLPALLMVAMVLGALLDRWSVWRRRDVAADAGRWRRALASVPSSALAIVIVVALLAMIVSEVGRNTERAGNIYRTTMVRSFVAAYQQARTEYPQYPIVLSRDYRQLLTPLFFPRAPSDVQAHSSLTPWNPPEPPFLHLGEANRSHATHISQDHGDVAVQTLAEVHVPMTRVAALGRILHQVFALLPDDDDPPLLSRRRGTAIRLVTAPGDDPLGAPVALADPGAAATPGIAALTSLPLVGFDRSVRIDDLVDGHFVSWSESESIALQFFDRSDGTTATTSPAAQLPGDARALRLAFDLRLTRGDQATVEVAAAGHGVGDAPRVVARARETVTLAGRARYTRVLLDLVSSEPMGSWRGRITVTPEPSPGSSGGLHIARPRLLEP